MIITDRIYGKVEVGETYEDSARRETLEEVGITLGRLAHLADLHFYFDGTLGVVSRAYMADFTSEPAETDEMRPQFFAKDHLPYHNMWPADKLWIPNVLAADSTPLGLIIHFDSDKHFKTLEQVEPAQLSGKF